MDVIEQFTCGKYADPARNEDALVVGEHFVAIVDGATAKSETLWDGMRSGRFASRVLARSLAGYSDDLGALTAALLTLSHYIDDEVKEKTRRRLQQWFGPAPAVNKD